MSLDTGKILIIGLGEIGYANAEYFTSIDLTPAGYDINDVAVNRALADKVIKTRATSFADYDIFIVCVGTHNPEKMDEAYPDPLFQVMRNIASQSKKGSLVCVESTMPLGVATQLGIMLTPDRHLVVAPHRYYRYEADIHGVNQKRTMGAMNKCCMGIGLHFYENVLKIPMRPASSMDLAVFSKLVENSDRHLKISWIQQLKLACNALGFSYEELRTIVNDKWNTGLLEAKDGIGGHCLPKDSQMFVDALKMAGFQYANLIELSKIQNEQYKIITRHKEAPLENAIPKNE